MLLSYADKHNNEYNNPSKTSIIDYGYPVFASYHSYVKAYTELDLVYMLPILYYIPQSVDYYSENGELLAVQEMMPYGPDSVLNPGVPEIFTLNQNPLCTSTFALFWLDESVSHVAIPIVTYFDTD